METTFALAYLTAFILLAFQFERQTSKSASALGLMAGFAFLVRPDLALFTCGTLLTMAVAASDSSVRRAAFRAGLISALFLAAWMALADVYFHSPVPMPFYAKSTSLYEESYRHTYAAFAPERLRGFFTSYWYLAALFSLYALINLRHLFSRGQALEKAILITTIAYLLYIQFGVLQIMGYAWRFYFPMLPPLAFLAARGINDAVFILRQRIGFTASVRRLWITRGAALALLVTLLPQTVFDYRAAVTRAWLDHAAFTPLDRFRGGWWQNFWFRLDAFSKLPDDLAIATWDVGLPGILNPNKTIVDLGGLNQREIIFQRIPPEALLLKRLPDLVYLPNPEFPALRASLMRSIPFNSKYEVFSPESIHAITGIALLRTSPHYREMNAIMHKPPLAR